VGVMVPGMRHRRVRSGLRAVCDGARNVLKGNLGALRDLSTQFSTVWETRIPGCPERVRLRGSPPADWSIADDPGSCKSLYIVPKTQFPFHHQEPGAVLCVKRRDGAGRTWHSYRDAMEEGEGGVGRVWAATH